MLSALRYWAQRARREQEAAAAVAVPVRLARVERSRPIDRRVGTGGDRGRPGGGLVTDQRHRDDGGRRRAGAPTWVRIASTTAGSVMVEITCMPPAQRG